jgi:hypothetical protein
VPGLLLLLSSVALAVASDSAINVLMVAASLES